MHALRTVAMIVVLALAVVVASTGGVADSAAAQDSGDPGALRDTDLLAALESVGYLHTWYELSPHGDAASSMAVHGTAGYQNLRSELLADAAHLVQSRAGSIELIAAIAGFEQHVVDLEQVTRSVRTRLRTDDTALAKHEARAIHKALRAHDTPELAELAWASESLAELRVAIREQVTNAARRSKDTRVREIATLGALLGHFEALFDNLAQMTATAEEMSAPQAQAIARIEAAIPELHSLRQRATTPIDALPVVTLDAYIRAGDHGESGCTVDWALLAGIGRIESIHGTLGRASVAASGAVRPRIFGPLLDGGATEREATEAIERAETQAARVAAQEEAELAGLAQAEAERRERELYGVLSDPAESGLTGIAPAGEQASESGESSSALDELAQDDGDQGGDGQADEQPEEDEDDGKEELDEESEAAGNGFAVISDTDGGALDGNARWDRAVGPMQFIPSTWRLWKVDGDGDGTVDPHNLYDATASAASYLCHLERRNGPSPLEYVLGYNSSTSYVETVVETASRLSEFELPSRSLD